MSSGAQYEETAETQAAIVSVNSYESGLGTLAVTLEKCYNECRCEHPDFKNLRRSVMDYALVYRSVHLQASKVFLGNLSDVMAYYADLTFEQFLKFLPVILEALDGYQVQAQLVSDLHNVLMEDIQGLQLKVKYTERGLAKEQSDSTTKRDQLQAKAARHDKKVIGNLVGVVAGMLLAPVTGGVSLLGSAAAGAGTFHHASKSDKSIEASAAKARDAKSAAQAAQLISGPISQSIKELANAIQLMASFFQYIKNEVDAYHSKAKTADAALQQNILLKAEMHFTLMKQDAERLRNIAKSFLARVPQFESYLAVLAKYEGQGQSSYPQVWMKNKAPQLAIEDNW